LVQAVQKAELPCIVTFTILPTKARVEALHVQEYGSGRQELGLPPLEPSADGSEGVPKLGDYFMFGKLMGEKPAEVQRQLQLNSTAFAVDEESLEVLSE